LRYEIEHPVVNDADYKIWNRYESRSWPSLRIIDPEGNLVSGASGEIDFATLNRFFEENLPYYREHGLLDEKPLHFDRESAKTSQTALRYPGKILADEKGGRLFIADSNHNRIVVASLDGVVQAVIGTGAIGRADGDFATAGFNHPQGMALAGDSLYVADTENHLLRKVDLKERRVKTIAGTGQQARTPWTDDNARPTEVDLNSPWALATQGNKLFIAMAGAHQIWEMPLDESKIRSYAGNGREDIVDGALLSSQPFQSGYSSFAQPSGLATDGKWLFVADSEGSSVRAVPLDEKKEVRTLIGTADLSDARLFTFGDVDGPNGLARLQHCLDVAWHAGHIYVADTYNSKIKVIDLKSGQCTTLAGTGQKAYEDSADPKHAKFFEPAGLGYAAGKLFVADTNNHRIRVISLAEDGAKATAVKTLELVGLRPPQQTAGAQSK
jgi:sugar lactone lactonase YvrE